MVKDVEIIVKITKKICNILKMQHYDIFLGKNLKKKKKVKLWLEQYAVIGYKWKVYPLYKEIID
jgi:hypothetical protein